MAMSDPPIRRATPADAGALAELGNMAGDGLPLHLWSRIAEPGEDGWAVGRARARRDMGSFSHLNAIVAEEAGNVVACLIGYPEPQQPEPIDYETMPPIFAPLQELENLAPGSWYVNVLACYPAHRCKGHGTRLLAVADQIAAESGARGLSLIVSDANVAACRLYQRVGFRAAASRPMVKEDWPGPGEEWVLIVKGG